MMRETMRVTLAEFIWPKASFCRADQRAFVLTAKQTIQPIGLIEVLCCLAVGGHNDGILTRRMGASALAVLAVKTEIVSPDHRSAIRLRPMERP